MWLSKRLFLKLVSLPGSCESQRPRTPYRAQSRNPDLLPRFISRHCLTPESLGRLIDDNCQTLRTLHLDLRDVSSPRPCLKLPSSVPINGRYLAKPAPSLRALPVLERLFFNSALMYNGLYGPPTDADILVDSILTSLVTLTLADNMGNRVAVCLEKSLSGLAQAPVHGKLPSLKKV